MMVDRFSCGHLRTMIIIALACLGGCLGENDQILAIRAGDREALAQALDDGVDANAKSRSGWPLIVEAAYSGRVDMVSLLIEHGASVDAANNNGFTALGEAARDGHIEVLKRLLAAKADPKRSDKTGGVWLQWAVMGGHVKSVELLLGAGAPIERENSSAQTPLLIAIGAKQIEMVRYLLAAGANPNHVTRRNGDMRNAPLASAAGVDDGEAAMAMVRLLIDAGAEVEQEGWRNSTAIVAAAQHDNLDCVRLLIAVGADVNRIGTYYQRTPLMFAVASHNKEMVAALLRAGAQPDVPIDGGYVSATAEAVKWEQSDLLEMLLRAGGEPNLEISGKTLLRQALDRGDSASAAALRAYGAQ